MINLTEQQKSKPNSKPHMPIDTLQFVPGIWVNGKYIWLQNCMEKVIYDEELIMKVKQEHIHSKIRLFSIYVSNHSNQPKEIKILAMNHFLNVGQDHFTFVSPTDRHIFHHAVKKVFLVNAQFNLSGIKEYTTMPLWNAYTDHIWSSLQRGNLKYQPLVKGPSASIFAIKTSIAPHQTNKTITYTISGSNKKELISMEQALLKNTSISF
ncbi:hypothetical protein J1P26_07100 [Neobacillus sp. MM2021_6]|uniref:hypothetical protein n=1 Tax=Bacillaceae TaxID=186817 RepID=UPI00140E51DD|nr:MULTISPECIES: hypothetical protein [Bacillaceae]MBO0959499.1 hypothetical protein [Neobacillus sp. MM2021_6]NHC17203.1 hypothetical protein [Bacillus sp. MM2020_4]